MNMNYILLVLGIVLIIISIMMFRHKGAFLIAGYNTMSEKEKAKVDKIKLTNVMGVICLSFAIMLIGGYFNIDALIHLTMPILVFTLGFVFLGQRYILNEEGKKEYDQKSHKMSKIAGIIVLVLVTFFFYRMLYTGEVNYEVLDDHIDLNSSSYRDISLYYDDIESIEVVSEFTAGHKANGVNNFVLSSGKFENEELGRYMLYAYNDAASYLIIEDKRNGYIVYGDSVQKINELKECIDKATSQQ